MGEVAKVDDKTWRFKLREGVKFHDGAPFNAETAVKAIHRTMDTTLKTGARGTGGLDCETRTKSFGDLKIVPKAIDAYTLEIPASKAVPILPTRMGVVSLSSPNTPLDKLVLNPIGTGPYKFEKWVPGQEITLTRFDGYWGKKPEAAGVRYLWRKESAVRASMVKVGEADIAPDIAVQDANDPSMDFSYPNSETSRLRIDMTRPPLNDKRVRLALNYAIDRAALKNVLSKDVIPATQIVVSGINGHNPNLKPYPYDPARAKKLLAEAKAAGVPVGYSLRKQRPAMDMVLEAYPTTLKLAGVTMLLASALAIVVGALAAYRPGGLFDRVSGIASLAGASAPDFWLAITGILVFSVSLGWLPTSGTGGFSYWIMPITVLALRPFGLLVQVVRASMLGALSSAYVKTARAKGIRERSVVFVHALRNACLPIVTVAGDLTVGLINGAVIVETVFGWPGVGKLMIDSVIQRDFPLVQATIMVTATAIFLLNIAIDLIYVALDPRIRYQ